MKRSDFESLKRGLEQALAHVRGEDVGCVVHRIRVNKREGVRE